MGPLHEHLASSEVTEPPGSPELRGYEERRHGCDPLALLRSPVWRRGRAPIKKAAEEAEYDCIRPHQALDGRTPMEYLRQRHPELAPDLTPHLSHMY